MLLFTDYNYNIAKIFFIVIVIVYLISQQFSWFKNYKTVSNLKLAPRAAACNKVGSKEQHTLLISLLATRIHQDSNKCDQLEKFIKI